MTQMPPSMPEQEWRELTNIDPHCFACGQENPMGLQMRFATNGEKMRSQLEVPKHMRGWSHLVHGGVITTAMDEMMAWTGIYFLNRFLLTKDIKVRFKLPLYVEEAITVYGWIAEQKNDRQVILAAEIINSQGQVAAKAEGEFVLFTAEKFSTMKLAPDEDLNLLKGMFRDEQHQHSASCSHQE